MQKLSQRISSLYFFSIAVFLLLLCSGCAPKQHQKTLEPGVHYSGYSAGFQSIKQDLLDGQYEELVQQLNARDAQLKEKHKYDDSFAQDMGILNLFENTSLYLQTGNVERSLEYSRFAEELIEHRDNEAYFFAGLRKVGTTFGALTGGEEYGAYDPVGYEKVLLLNIEAMNYLLKGDDRAFNVALKSTDWQEEEREKFIENLKEVSNSSPSSSKKPTDKARKKKVYERLAEEFAKYDKKALQVPSAFVNPFGDYLAGVVKEFKSVELKSMTSNAYIHYNKALKLNPGSKVLKLSAKDMKKKRSAENLIQLVAFDGFVPEKKILSFDIEFKGCQIPIHIEAPIYDPVPSKVHKIVVSTTSGKNLATFRQLADIEALALRHQKDMLPAIQALIAIAAVRDAAIATTKESVSKSISKQFRQTRKIADSLNNLLGNLVSGFEASLEPDTSSWMSLPSRILAARFHPGKNIKKIRITSYDVKGKKLARQTITLDKGGRHFVFVRSLDNRLQVIPGKKIWSPKEKNK